MKHGDLEAEYGPGMCRLVIRPAEGEGEPLSVEFGAKDMARIAHKMLEYAGDEALCHEGAEALAQRIIEHAQAKRGTTH